MSSVLRTVAAPYCKICGGDGGTLYTSLCDRLLSVPGEWSLRRCRDDSCGLVWLDPMPTPEDIAGAYADYYTHVEQSRRETVFRTLLELVRRGYLHRRFGYYPDATVSQRLLGLAPLLYPGRTAELDFSVMWLPVGRRGRLLDIGAGSGWLVRNMAALGWQAEGLDFDHEAVATARRRGLTMHAGSLAEQNFPDASFDAVTMSHSIEHLHDARGWLAEIRRVLKPHGRLVVVTPNTASLGHRLYGPCWFPLDPPRHLYLFNRRNLVRLVRAAEFDVVADWTSIRDANGVFIGSRNLRARGRHDMLAPRSPIAKTIGRLMQSAESFVRLLWHDAGEEVVLLAEKPQLRL